MADEWSAPSPQDYAGPADDGVRRMLDVIERQRRELDEMRNNLLKTAGLSVEPDTLRTLGNLAVDGALTTSGATVLGGDVAITGALTLNPNAIGNEALANPVRFTADFQDVEGPLNITNAETTLSTISLTVPAGFSSAFVVGYGSIGVVNPTGATSSLAGRVYITTPNGTQNGPRRYQAGPAGADIAVFPYKQRVDAALTGGATITVHMNVINTGASWGSTIGGASLNVHAYFTR